MKVHKCIARNTRYVKGTYIESKKGKIRRTYYKPNPGDDEVLVEKGEPYYWFKRKNQEKKFFRDKPNIRDFKTKTGWEIFVENVSQQVGERDIESLRETLEDQLSEIEEKKSNMECYPGLESTPNYELLSEREEQIREALDNVESAECLHNEDEQNEFLEQISFE